jgi:hypothetical protein
MKNLKSFDDIEADIIINNEYKQVNNDEKISPICPCFEEKDSCLTKCFKIFFGILLCPCFCFYYSSKEIGKKTCQCCDRFCQIISQCCDRFCQIISQCCDRFCQIISQCCDRFCQIISQCCEGLGRMVRFLWKHFCHVCDIIWTYTLGYLWIHFLKPFLGWVWKVIKYIWQKYLLMGVWVYDVIILPIWIHYLKTGLWIYDAILLPTWTIYLSMGVWVYDTIILPFFIKLEQVMGFIWQKYLSMGVWIYDILIFPLFKKLEQVMSFIWQTYLSMGVWVYDVILLPIWIRYLLIGVWVYDVILLPFYKNILRPTKDYFLLYIWSNVVWLVKIWWSGITIIYYTTGNICQWIWDQICYFWQYCLQNCLVPIGIRLQNAYTHVKNFFRDLKNCIVNLL